MVGVGGFECPQVWALAFEVILRGGTVVAVVERGEFCGVLRTVLFLWFFVNFCGLCFFVDFVGFIYSQGSL